MMQACCQRNAERHASKHSIRLCAGQPTPHNTRLPPSLASLAAEGAAEKPRRQPENVMGQRGSTKASRTIRQEFAQAASGNEGDVW